MIRRTLRRSPVAILVFVALITVAAFTGGFGGPDIAARLAFATGYGQVVHEGRWWTPLTSAFLTDGGWELLVIVIAAPLLVGVAERALGSLRTALAFVACGVIGVTLGIAVQAIGVAAGELWSERVAETLAIDPMTPVVGALMTASAFSGRFWRGRIRVATISSVLVFMLYSGQPSDVYRLFAAVIGLGLGYLLHPRDQSPFWPRSSHHEARVLVSVVIAVSALGPVLTVFNRVRLGPLAPLGLLLMANRPSLPRPSLEQCQSSVLFAHGCFRAIALERIDGAGPILLTILPLVALLVAAISVLRGQRFGAWLAIVVNLAMSALAALFYGFVPMFPLDGTGRPPTIADWELQLDLTICTIVPLVIAIVVLANLKHLTVRMSRRVIRWYLSGVGIALLATAGLYVAVGSAVRDQFSPRVNVADLLSDLPDRFAPVGFLRAEPLAFAPVGPGAIALYDWVGPLFWIVVVLGALVVALRPSRRIAWGQARAGALLRAGGGGSLSYWSMWKGNHYWFSADGRAAVAYRVVNGIAVTTSEPFGERDSAVRAIAEFARFCDDNSWIVFYYGIHSEFAEAAMQMGWSANIIGDETIVYPAEWNTTGKHWQDVRTSINRAERDGLTANWTRFSELTLRQRRQIEEISELWVAEKGLPEMGFTLGGIDELRDDDVRLMVAIGASDEIVGITSWLPTYTEGRQVGWTLDFMRRTPDGPNGVMEFLIARAAEQFRIDGIEFMSLSTAPLTRSASSAPEISAMARMLRYIGNRLEPVYGFQSLFNFKRKFKPQFSPVYMAYPDALALPTIGLALARTYVPTMSMREGLKFVRTINRSG
jgi:phosphatidylglycerol lysyltransferase